MYASQSVRGKVNAPHAFAFPERRSADVICYPKRNPFWAIFSLALCSVAPLPSAGQTVTIPMTTSDRVLSKGWWPTKGTEARDQYVGSAACAGCHKDIVESQSTTAMAHALTSASEDKSAASGPLSFRIGVYSYSIARTAAALTYSADDGIRSVSTNLGWVFGSGHFGQTYVYQDKGVLYESNLSYFSGIHSLDFTTGHLRAPPANLEKALGSRSPPIRFEVVLVAIQRPLPLPADSIQRS